jgi:hypothetical protein
MNVFDFDGVVSIGVHPGPGDIIVTGRSFEEAREVNRLLTDRGIFCAVYFNPIRLSERTTGTDKSRTSGGLHKAAIISMFKENRVMVNRVFEDDELQVTIIKNIHPELEIVHLVHDLVTK